MRLVFDIETNPLDFSRGDFIDQVHTIHCIVTKDIDTGQIGKYYDTNTGLRELGTAKIRRGIDELRKATELIGHNITQFDAAVLRKLFDFKTTAKITDTLVLSRLLYPDRPGGHSLRSWGERLNYPKQEFDQFESFSLEMLTYCKRDVDLNGRVYKQLRDAATPEWGKAISLEHDFARIIAEQEAIGFYFNKTKAEELVENWENEIDNLDNVVHSTIDSHTKPGPIVSRPFKINGDLSKRALDVCDNYNINSGDIGGPFCAFDTTLFALESKTQQKEILKELGWTPTEYTPTGLPRLNESMKDVGAVGESLFRRNKLSHRRSQVSGLIELTDKYGRVHGGGNPCGTNTHRMRQQRIVNIPRASTEFGVEMRGLFTVPATKVLVGYDAAGLELRILAHYIGSEEYIQYVINPDKTQNAHTLAAKAAGSDDYDLGKTINYALIYGAGDRKLGSIIGAGPTDGALLRANLYLSVPGLEEFIARVKSAAKKGYLLGLDGRKLYLRPRVAPQNTLIQGGGAVFMKTVAVILDRIMSVIPSAFKVIDMHDEAQWEIYPDEEAWIEIAITRAFNEANEILELKCPQEAEIKIGKTWAETH